MRKTGSSRRTREAEEGGRAASLALRVDALAHKVAAAQHELFTLAVRPGSLPTILAGLFAGPARLLRGVGPYSEIAPRVRVSFGGSAILDVVVEPKALRPESAGAYPFSVELALDGSSPWLALEADMTWADLGAGRHYQLSVQGTPSREVDCNATLRLARDDGTYLDHVIARWTLSPDDRFLLSSGSIDLSVPHGIDRRRKPILLFFLDTRDELRLRFDQIVASFA